MEGLLQMIAHLPKPESLDTDEDGIGNNVDPEDIQPRIWQRNILFHVKIKRKWL